MKVFDQYFKSQLLPLNFPESDDLVQQCKIHSPSTHLYNFLELVMLQA